MINRTLFSLPGLRQKLKQTGGLDIKRISKLDQLKNEKN